MELVRLNFNAERSLAELEKSMRERVSRDERFRESLRRYTGVCKCPDPLCHLKALARLAEDIRSQKV